MVVALLLCPSSVSKMVLELITQLVVLIRIPDLAGGLGWCQVSDAVVPILVVLSGVIGEVYL
jgi:hypothetical protein